MPRTALLSAFAAANDSAAATGSKLAKQAALAAYFRTLDDPDLPLAVRYAGGRPFAATDERVLGVSGAAVSAVVTDIFKLQGHDWYRRLTAAGEFGEAMASLWAERPPAPSGPPLLLQDLQATWDALADAAQQEVRRTLLRALLDRVQTPREAAYIGKIIFSDLRTGVREGVLHAAIAEAFGRPLADIRRAILFEGDIGAVALLAKLDRLNEAQFRLFHPIGFMLAGAVETAQEAAEAVARRSRKAGQTTPAEDDTDSALGPPPSALWLAEHKLDGIRAQIHKEGDGSAARLAIYTRTLDRIDESFPDIIEHARHLPGDWLLDGEIVPYDDATGLVLPFAVIQKRLGRKRPSPGVIRSNPCRFVAFDLLFHDDQVLLDMPLSRRREALAELLGAGSSVLLSAAVPVGTEQEIEEAFTEARGMKNEGLVLKDPASRYTPGRRGQAWLKLKTHLPTLDVVVTAAEHGHGRRRQVLSDYTFAVWDRDPGTSEDAALVNVGKAYSGVTDEEIRRLTELFLQIQVGRAGHVYAVRPQVVLEVAFDAIQASDRHASGYALRFPRIKRIRWEKSPESADTLERVREIFEHEQNLNRSRVADPEADPQLPLF